MALRDGKISAMMGGVSRAIGNDVTDLATLERRRDQAQKLWRRPPAVPFAEVLAAGAEGDAEGEPTDDEQEQAAEGRPNPYRPRGRARILRG